MNAYPNRTRSTLLLLAGLLFAFLPMGWGNNIQVSNVTLGSRDPSSKTAPITFTLTWENAWNADYSQDAAWVFVKFRKSGTPTWHHAYLGSGPTHDYGWSHELGYDDDGNHILGVFLRNTNLSSTQTDVSTTVTLYWKYNDNDEQPLEANDNAAIQVFAIEMVRVPGGGSFKLGDGGASNFSLRSSRGGGPFIISSSGQGDNVTDIFDPIAIVGHDSVSIVTSSTTISLDYQLPEGENLYSLVSVYTRDKNVTSLTIDGASIPLIRSQSSGSESRVFVFGFVPNSQHHGKPLVGTLDKATDKGIMLSVSTFNNVRPDLLGYVNDKYTTDTDWWVREEGITWEKSDLIYSAFGTEKAQVIQFGAGQEPIFSTETIIKEIHTAASIKYAGISPNDSISYGINAKDKETSLVTVVLHHQQPGGYSLSGVEGLDNNPSFPTGYNSFYCMKYEVTQAQYVAFLNTLKISSPNQQDIYTDCSPSDPPGTQALSPPNNNYHRNGIQIVQSGNQFPAIFACNLDNELPPDDPDHDGMPKACNYLSWNDLAAWLDWAALRPMTELEYEKVSRPISKPNAAQSYPWGTTSPNFIPSNSISNEGSVGEELTEKQISANVNAGGNYPGPLRVGFFARDTIINENNDMMNRKSAGSSLTGVMDLAGNLWEMVVTIETSEGRAFQGNHGNGSLEDQAWPDLSSEFGIGCRGGAWNSTLNQELRVSNRSHVSYGPAGREPAYGGRGVRTAN